MTNLQTLTTKEREKEVIIEHCNLPECPACDKAAYERGYADGKREAELIMHKKVRKLILEE